MIIILVRPQMAENIGAVARIMGNFGLTQLRLVAPIVSPTDPKSLAVSAGADAILQSVIIYNALTEAIADCHTVYGTSASDRHMIKPYGSPKALLQDFPQDGALVFGPERTGLLNEELSLCQKIIQIPVNPSFSSLNLAQAVAIIAYELFQRDQFHQEELHMGETKLANHATIQGFLTAFESQLDTVNYWRVPSKKPLMWRTLQNIFTRHNLTDQEVQTLHGVLKSLFKSKL